jgi:hypothetical protein
MALQQNSFTLTTAIWPNLTSGVDWQICLSLGQKGHVKQCNLPVMMRMKLSPFGQLGLWAASSGV